jgi:hypothetical protein
MKPMINDKVPLLHVAISLCPAQPVSLTRMSHARPAVSMLRTLG